MSPGAMEVTRSATFVVNDAFATSRPGVFAAGDAVSGPATIIQAIAHGNLVAVAVDQWLRTGKMEAPKFITPRYDVAMAHDMQAYATARRPENPKLPVNQREGSFREV